MRRFLLVIVCVAIGIAAAGCAGTSAPRASRSVSGTLRSGYGGAYPLGSVLVLRIVDPLSSSRVPVAETSASIVPGWEVAGMHQAIDFDLPYDPTRIDPARAYVISAEVIDGDETIAVSKEPGAVITQGAPTSGLELTLVAPSDLATPASPGY
jgi:uncharacterized lipoprotein YbaY